MKLPFFEKSEGQGPKIALSIQTDMIYGCLFDIDKGTINITALEEEAYEEESLTEKLITILRKLSHNTPSSSLDVIFGVPEEFIDGEKIKVPFEGKLREATTVLHQNSVAFVSNPKALSFFLEKEDGRKPNAIVLNLGRRSHRIFLFQEGQVKNDLKVHGTSVEELVDKVSSLGENLPSQVFIWGFEPPQAFVEQVRQIFLNQLRGSFHNEPKIEVLPKDSTCLSVSLATAYDLGYLENSQPVEVEKGTNVETKREEEKKSDQFGFIHDQDILESHQISQPEPREIKEEPQAKERFSLPSLSLDFVQLPFTLLSTRKKYILVSIPLIALVFGLVSLWWFLPSSKITLKVKSQVLEKEENVLVGRASPGGLTGTLVESLLSGSQKAVTTGKKEVGDKAQGEVILFNKTSQPKTFTAGTILKTTSGVVFALNSQATVASRSATLEGITYGKTKTNVTAQDFGTEGNIAANTNFTIADFDQSLYSAYNEQSFSGGTKREVSVVSQDDRKKLQDNLTKELETKATEELKAKVPPNSKIEDTAIQKEVISQKFDKEVAQEASVVSLTQEVKFSAVAYSQDELFKFLAEKIKEDVPSSYEILSDFSKVEIIETLPEGEGFILRTKFTGSLIPKFDTPKITNELVGKNPKTTKDYLLALQDVQEAQIAISPPLPAFLLTMPHVPGRISIRVEPDI